jgi:hypothetical protein
MSPNQRSDVRDWIWLAGAVGTAAGVASLAYRRKKRSPWEHAKQTIVRAADKTRSEAKPWMGALAAAVAGSATLVHRLSRKGGPWERARYRAGRVAARTGMQLRPWISVAASTAIGPATAAYHRKEWEKANGAVSKRAGAAAGKLAGTGLGLLKRVLRISAETRRLHPRVRRLVA